MRIFVNRAPIRNQPWGGGAQFTNNFFDYASDFGCVATNRLDASVGCILIQDPRPDQLGIGLNEIIEFKKQNPSVKIVHRVNECSARKGEDDSLPDSMDNLLRETSKYTDKTIFVSRWMGEGYHLRKDWYCKNTSVVVNGVNKNWFHPRDKFNNGKVNVVAHHWSDNTLKGHGVYADISGWADDGKLFTFTHIGRIKEQAAYQKGVVREVKTISKKNCIGPYFGQELGNRLGQYDVYISASKFDPGPNHILEALACGLPTYVLDEGGGCVEFAGTDHVYSTSEELEKILISGKYKPNSYIPDDWYTCIKKYIQEIKS